MVFHKRVEIFKQEFLAFDKKGPFGKVRDYWFRFEYQERGRVHLHGVVWCEANSIPDDVICATMPRESDGFDPKFTAYLRDLYKVQHGASMLPRQVFQYWSWACMHQVQVGLSL